jgi:hypothetical protein
MIAPKAATRIDHRLKPVAPVPPNNPTMSPPITAPTLRPVLEPQLEATFGRAQGCGTNNHGRGTVRLRGGEEQRS